MARGPSWREDRRTGRDRCVGEGVAEQIGFGVPVAVTTLTTRGQQSHIATAQGRIWVPRSLTSVDFSRDPYGSHLHCSLSGQLICPPASPPHRSGPVPSVLSFCQICKLPDGDTFSDSPFLQACSHSPFTLFYFCAGLDP
jgi:hypothetical protein